MAETTAGSAAAGNEPVPGAAHEPNNDGQSNDSGAQRRTRKRTAKAAPSSSEQTSSPADGTRSRRRAVKNAPAEVIPGLEPTGPDAVPAKSAPRRRAKAASTGVGESGETGIDEAPAGRTPAKRTRRRADAGPEPGIEPALEPLAQPRMAPTTAVFFMAPEPESASPAEAERESADTGTDRVTRRGRRDRRAPEPEPETEAETVEAEPARGRRTRRVRRGAEPAAVEAEPIAVDEEGAEDEDEFDAAGRRRRRRGRRGRGRGRGPLDTDETDLPAADEGDTDSDTDDGSGDDEPLTRRRRRRRRSGTGGEAEGAAEDGVVTVVRVRQPRDEVQGVSGSTRLEAKRQRRRDGREQRRTRPPILSESEFLARREAVDRVMVVRQKGDRTQVAVLEDGILVEHYVARQSASTMVGNVYLGKVQNVLPSMEAAFVDIGRGRNAVLYAGEVNWDATGLEGRARSIEQALKSGDSVLVQVTKDPIGHKGARLTSHVALSGRHLVYVPNGHASGISRKLSDVERRRLRDILKNLVPDGAGVIVRTAAEGAAEEDLARDVKRLQAQWEDIQAKAATGGAPAVLSAEPDLVIRVVRDLFNEDFREIVIQGTDAYEQVDQYLAHVSPDLVARVRRHTGTADAFAEWRIDEQILKGLDRKVFLPSGGHLVIDRTEAMTVVDVNTGKYTGAGGNLEETVTRNNLEAAEEIVRQLRLRDLGGIIVIDFIDMVLESNRDLVLRRLTECLGRDRTKHQVTEITSLGLVQMTRKRIGQGLLEAFSETCEHCKGRGVLIQTEPVADKPRANVAEKVRAMAASSRAVSQDDTEPELPDVDDGPLTDVDGDDGVDDLVPVGDDAENPSARRRARRGSSRRRTRP
jgi:ribonuclease E